jgi:multiple sugar transport system permease protein
MNKKINQNLFDNGFAFLIPSLAGFILFFILPFIISLYYSFLDKPIESTFVGLKNYADLILNPSYLMGLKNTLIFILMSVPLNMLLSLMMAMLLLEIKKFKDLFMLILLIPLVIPSGSMMFFWENLFSNNGYVNRFLSFVNMPEINWLDSEYSRFVLVCIFIWKNLGYNAVLFSAGLNNIPRLYYEAAEMDGAGKLRAFFNVTLANLLPTFVLVSIMSIINSFKIFKEVFLLMGSYPHKSVYMMQHFMNNMFASLNYPKLTSATIMMVLIIAVTAHQLLKYEQRKNV